MSQRDAMWWNVDEVGKFSALKGSWISSAKQNTYDNCNTSTTIWYPIISFHHFQPSNGNTINQSCQSIPFISIPTGADQYAPPRSITVLSFAQLSLQQILCISIIWNRIHVKVFCREEVNATLCRV